MKRLGLLLVCFATLAMASCGSLGGATGSNSAAQMSGQSCGMAMQQLYGSYKATGKVDLTNATNLSNALIVATACTNLKANKGDKGYRSAFTSGLIASSAGLITSANATAFVDQLLNSAGLTNINSQNIAQTAATAAAIVTLLNALK